MRTAVGAMLALVAVSPAIAVYDCEVAKLAATAKSGLCRHEVAAAALDAATPPSTARCDVETDAARSGRCLPTRRRVPPGGPTTAWISSRSGETTRIPASATSRAATRTSSTATGARAVDLNTDPWQLVNVIAELDYDAIRAELAAQLGEVCG
jgi:hypothetical protein